AARDARVVRYVDEVAEDGRRTSVNPRELADDDVAHHVHLRGPDEHALRVQRHRVADVREDELTARVRDRLHVPPRTTCPGSAPVQHPASSRTSPLTIVAT